MYLHTEHAVRKHRLPYTISNPELTTTCIQHNSIIICPYTLSSIAFTPFGTIWRAVSGRMWIQVIDPQLLNELHAPLSVTVTLEPVVCQVTFAEFVFKLSVIEGTGHERRSYFYMEEKCTYM